MLRWAVMFGMVAMSTWIACGLDERTVTMSSARAPNTGSGSAVTDDGGTKIFLDAPIVVMDAGLFMDAPVVVVMDAGTGSGSAFMDAGTGSGSGMIPIDAGIGMDAHRSNTDNLDKTNFYTCASCTTNDAGAGALLVLAVAALLRRRRR